MVEGLGGLSFGCGCCFEGKGKVEAQGGELSLRDHSSVLFPRALCEESLLFDEAAMVLGQVSFLHYVIGLSFLKIQPIGATILSTLKELLSGMINYN